MRKGVFCVVSVAQQLASVLLCHGLRVTLSEVDFYVLIQVQQENKVAWLWASGQLVTPRPCCEVGPAPRHQGLAVFSSLCFTKREICLLQMCSFKGLEQNIILKFIFAENQKDSFLHKCTITCPLVSFPLCFPSFSFPTLLSPPRPFSPFLFLPLTLKVTIVSNELWCLLTRTRLS